MLLSLTVNAILPEKREPIIGLHVAIGVLNSFLGKQLTLISVLIWP